MIGWLTTVTPEGQPQTFPIWFLWEDGEALIYSDRRAKRNGNIAANPRVSLHLNDDGSGGDVVIVEGEARVDDTTPPVTEHAGVPREVRRLDHRVPDVGRGDGDHLQRAAADPPDARPGLRRMSARAKVALAAGAAAVGALAAARPVLDASRRASRHG